MMLLLLFWSIMIDSGLGAHNVHGDDTDAANIAAAATLATAFVAAPAGARFYS